MTGADQSGPEHNLRLPASDRAPELARSYLLRHAPPLSATVRDDAELLVSELVTNAVRHGRSPITLHVSPNHRGVYVAVSDAGEQRPSAPATVGHQAESGRGLLIVNALAIRWGVTQHEHSDGKSVWFEI